MAKIPSVNRKVKPAPDHASQRAPREPGSAHIRLLLAGDFDSPQQVMASPDLDTGKKRQIFEVWIRDLRSKSEPEARRLLDQIREALAMLDSDKTPKR
jgi:hypothetical protein